MASRSTLPSKIPKLQTAPSSPRNRIPSIVEGSPPQATSTGRPQANKKSQSAMSSPRQSASYRASHGSSIPMSRQRITPASTSIKSKSDGGENRQQASPGPALFSPRSPPTLPGTEMNVEHRGQGEGDIPRVIINQPRSTEFGKRISQEEIDCALTGLIRPSSMKDATGEDMKEDATTTTAPRAPSQKEMCPSNERPPVCKSVNVLYAASPIRMESTASVTSPVYRKSPTYVDIYRQQKQHEAKALSEAEAMSSFERGDVSKRGSGIASCKTIDSLQVERSNSNSAKNSSLVWDYTDIQCKDFYTQTSRTVGTVDRASSCIPFPLESFSKESLLENQTKPLSVIEIDQTTEHEDSDGRSCPAESDTDGDCDQRLSCRTVKAASQVAPRENQDKPAAFSELMTDDDDGDGDVQQIEDFCYYHYNLEDEGIPLENKSNVIFNIDMKNQVFSPNMSREIHRTDLYDDEKETVVETLSLSKQANSSGVQSDLANQNREKEGTKQSENVGRSRSERTMSHGSVRPTDRLASSALSLQDWQTEKLIPKLNASSSGGAVEIIPSPVPLTTEELKMHWTPESKVLDKNEPIVASSAKSSIILKHCASDHGQTLKSYLELCNSTSFLQGYKIMVNHSAKEYLRVHPSMGLISPHAKVAVKITTDATGYSNETVSKFRLAVELFRAHCDDPTKLREFYNKLQDQHPELIQTKTIDRVIVWNNDDLPEMLEMLNSIPDERDRDALKEELHLQLSNDRVHEPRSSSREHQLNALRMGMIVANQTLRNVCEDLSDIRNRLLLLCFAGLYILAMIYVGPPLLVGQNPTIPEAPAPEAANVIDENQMNILERVMKMF